MHYFNTVITMLILCILTQILWYAIVILEEGISIVVQSEKERKSSKARGLPLKTFFKHHSLYGFRFKDFDRSLFLSLFSCSSIPLKGSRNEIRIPFKFPSRRRRNHRFVVE